jgi:hypothetical protein
MANPLLSVRIPPDLEVLLPSDRGQRSKVTIEALKAYLQPSNPEDKLSQLERRVTELERRLNINL